MPKSSSAPLTFYPAYCFSLSPTHNTWARLTAANVHALTERAGFEGQNLYFHLNHPIKWIRLIGVIVAVDIYDTRWILSLDDSSGAMIEITCGRPKSVQSTLPIQEIRTTGLADTPAEGQSSTGRKISLKGVDVGSVVKLKGGIGCFRGEKQLLLERISFIQTTNEEAAAWAENSEFYKNVLCSPWVVSEKDEKRARRKAEGLDREQQAKEKRKKQARAKLVTTKKPGDKVPMQFDLNQEKQMSKEANHAAAERDTHESFRINRAKERDLREQEFERLEAQKGSRRLESDAALRNESAQLKEAKQAIAEIEKQRHDEELRLARETDEKERARTKRDEERRLRKQEFERLKTLQEMDR